MIPGIRLDYQQLRTISPKAARQAVLQILRSCEGNVSETARILGITRITIYKAIRKQSEEDLDDASRAPKTIANRTPSDIEEKVLIIKQQTNYGPLRLKEELYLQHGITLSHHTIRNIVRRNRKKIRKKETNNHRRSPRQFVDWYQAKPFEIVQIDLKHIIDQKALSMDQISHIYAHNLPIYQWGAIDVNTRFKLIAYSREKTWTNGLTWFLWVTSWFRSHGVTGNIVYTVDHGVEFGGDCWWKMTELRHLLKGFGCSVIQNQKKHPEQNAHLERSYRTDDEEFYIPRILSINSTQELYREALNYLYYYNNIRKHSSLQGKTPFQVVQENMPTVNDKMRIVPPIILDRVSVDLGPWSGYHVLAQYLN
jgi:transposase